MSRDLAERSSEARGGESAVAAGRTVAGHAAQGPSAVAGRADLWAILLIAAVAIAIRIAFAASAPPFIDPDAEGYYVPGHDLVFGLPFQPDLRRTPVYPVFIAAVIALFGEDLQALVTVQHFVVGPASAVLTYALGRLLTGEVPTRGLATGRLLTGRLLTGGLPAGRLVPLVAALLVAVNGPLLVYEHYVLTDAPFTLLLLAVLVVTVWAARRASLIWAAVAGLLFGITILCRPAGQLVAPLLAGVLLLGAGPPRRRVIAVALCGGLAALVVVPWMASNSARHGMFAVAGSGRYLLARVVKNDPGGYSFEAPPGIAEEPVRAAARRIVQQEAARDRPGSTAQRFREELGLSEAETSRILTELAVGAIRERPVYYLGQTLEFAWEIMVGQPIAIRQESREWREIDWERRVRHVLQRPIHRLDAARAQSLVSVYDPARYGPLVPVLFGVGLLVAALGLAPRRLLLLGSIALLLVGSSAALVGPIVRYRVPADPLITLVVVQGVATVAGLALARVRRGAALTPRPPLPAAGEGENGVTNVSTVA